MQDQWLSVEQVAERAGVSVATVYTYLRSGQLPGFRLGGRLIRVKVADLDALITPLHVDESTP